MMARDIAIFQRWKDRRRSDATTSKSQGWSSLDSQFNIESETLSAYIHSSVTCLQNAFHEWLVVY